MYLELPDMASFLEELKDKKIKEVRIVPFYQQIPSNPVSITSLSVIMTATDGKDIIRYDELIGREPSVFKEQLEILGKKAEEFMTKAAKEIRGLKIEVKKGIYKYPSEISG